MKRIVLNPCENSDDISIDDFIGQICPVMSNYHTGKYVENSMWFGIPCLKDKCQWYGNRCPKAWNE